MALNKKMVKENGLTTEYHRILHIHIDCAKDTVMSVSVASYIDESYRLKEKNGECDSTYITIENYTVDVNINSDSLAFSMIYGKLKERDMFTDASNC